MVEYCGGIDDLEGRSGRLGLGSRVVDQRVAGRAQELVVVADDGVVGALALRAGVQREEIGIERRVAVHREDGPAPRVDRDYGACLAGKGRRGNLLERDRHRQGDVVCRLVLCKELAECRRGSVVLGEELVVLELEPRGIAHGDRLVTRNSCEERGCGRRVDPQLAVTVGGGLGHGEHHSVRTVDVASREHVRVGQIRLVVRVVHQRVGLPDLEVVQLQEEHDKARQQHETQPADPSIYHPVPFVGTVVAVACADVVVVDSLGTITVCSSARLCTRLRAA